jgi:hypothetical protein
MEAHMAPAAYIAKDGLVRHQLEKRTLVLKRMEVQSFYALNIIFLFLSLFL